jgi:hypothetical protein
MANIGNGWPVIDVRRSGGDHPTTTIYLRIPADIATPIDGGCSCDYCKAHPLLIPAWDTVAVSDERGGFSWTVHYPEPRPITPAERKELIARR